MNNTELVNLSDYYNSQGDIVIRVHDQISQLNYQYMRSMLFMSALIFGIFLFNFMFRFDNPKNERIGKALDAGGMTAGLYMLVVSIIYFTDWM